MTDQPQDPQPPTGPPSGSPAPQRQPPQAPPPAQPYGQQPHGQTSYGQQPYGAPPANPYGGYGAAPAYAAQGPAAPGSLRYVEEHFGPVATFGPRAGALLIDVLVSIAAFIPMLVAVPVLIAAAPRRTGYDEYGYPAMGEADSALLAVGLILLGIGLIVGIAVNLWNRVFRMGRTGQSIGKSALGLRLVHAQTGQPIGAGMCFVRELVSGAVNQVVYLSYLWMLWDDNRQTLADKVVTSTVIRVPQA